jgi:DNA polymerase-1
MYKEHLQSLKTELEQSKANVIVAVGAISLCALTGKIGITKWRGSVLESTLLPGRKVIPIIHPAAALRKYINRHFIRVDLARIVEESKYPELRLEKPNFILQPSLDHILSYLKGINDGDLIAFDIEVIRRELYSISIAKDKTEAICIPFAFKGQNYWSLHDEVTIMSALSNVLENPRINKMNQNIIFDAQFLFRRYGIVTLGISHDTMIGQGIAYPDFPKDLGFITSIYTRHPYYKDDGKQAMKLLTDDVSFWRYNCLDSIVVQDSMPEIINALEKQGNVETYQKQVALIYPLLWMTERGLPIDQVGLTKMRNFKNAQSAEIMETLKHTMPGVSPTSPAQLCKYFYETRVPKFPPYIKRGKGRPTVDGDALKRLSRKGAKEASLILKLRGINKLLGTYLNIPLSKDGWFRCGYNPIGTKQARLSSSRNIFGEGTNGQNLPPQMKAVMSAAPGYILFDLDLSQAENRIVAYVAPEPKMIKAFEDSDAGLGPDVHRITAGLIFNKPPELISDEPGSSSLGSGEYSERFWGKKANHGFNYDLGYKMFAFRYEIPENEGKFIYTRYHQVYPGIHKWHRAIVSELQTNNRILTNVLGRKRMFLDRFDVDMFKEAYSFKPQSTVGDIVNFYGLCNVFYNGDEFKDVELLLQVHDSMVFQLPLTMSSDEMAKIVMLIRDGMQPTLSAHGNSFHIPVDGKCGYFLKGGTKLDFSNLSNLAQSIEKERSRSRNDILNSNVKEFCDDTEMEYVEAEIEEPEESEQA